MERMGFVSGVGVGCESLRSHGVVCSLRERRMGIVQNGRARAVGRALSCSPMRMSGAGSDLALNSDGAEKTWRSALWDGYVKWSEVFANLFPVWTVLVALVGLQRPSVFTWLTTPYFTLSLGILMLSMGITLTIEDFKRVLRRFGAVAIGFVGCYVLMPALSYAVARAFNLSKELTAGAIVVGAVNGGQASNLCTFIARGNVALSVMMTTATTIGAVVMTPLISKILIGTVIPVNAVGIAMSTLQVILLPIILGMTINHFFPKAVKKILPFCPVAGVAATCLLVGSSVAQCAAPIRAAGWSLQISMAILHVVGGIAGYWMPRLAGYNEIVCRTSAIETAMKSSAFAFLLASLHFASFQVRVPAAVSVVWMALIGSTLAVIYRFIPMNHTVKFRRELANRKGPFDKWLKPSTSRT